ncbi:MAG TPA: DNA polymerase III subunit delta' [Methylocella sp.]|nr:DNA polymerase III subunit delta' [Methylocella sp.]
MPKRMATASESNPESDRYGDTPHPRSVSDFFGHTAALRTLQLAHATKRFPQALIISGPPGIGKATLAWRLARFFLAQPGAPENQALGNFFVPQDHPVARQITAMSHPDLILLRREWNERDRKFFADIRVEDVRRAVHLFQQAAGGGGYRICVIDNADDLNANSANALLKLIEEPPPCSLFLITATLPGRMLATLRSRCQRIFLKPLAPSEISAIILSLKRPPETESELEAAANHAEGSVHKALRLLVRESAALDLHLRKILDDLPRIDWQEIHALASRLAATPAQDDFEAMLGSIKDWLGLRTRQSAKAMPSGSAAALAPYALVWEKLTEATRELEIFNLDKRLFILNLFSDLAAAARPQVD